jgi:hypothetical protein
MQCYMDDNAPDPDRQVHRRGVIINFHPRHWQSRRGVIHHAPAHLSNCSPAEQLTCRTAHPPSCSPVELLTCRTAHPPSCSPAELLTCRTAHPPNCSPAELLTCRTAHLSNCSPAELLTCRAAYLPNCSPAEQLTCRAAYLSNCSQGVVEQSAINHALLNHAPTVVQAYSESRVSSFSWIVCAVGKKADSSGSL